MFHRKFLLLPSAAMALSAASAQAYLLTDTNNANVHYEDFQGQPGTAQGSLPAPSGGPGTTSPLDPTWDYSNSANYNPTANDAAVGSPHITSPSNTDYLQTGGVALSMPLGSLTFGSLSQVNDGLLSQNSDDTSRIFADTNHANYRIQADFPSSQFVTEATSYSWHGGSRTVQKYDLYGSNAATADGSNLAGWTLIASVNSSVLDGVLGNGAGSFDENSKHGVDIGGPLGTGGLGQYQHLLWDIFNPNAQTWYSEFDVYVGTPTPEPASLGLLSFAGLLVLRRRHRA